MKKTLISLLFLFFAIQSTSAQNGISSAYRFLNIPVSAKAASLGGAPVSLRLADPSHMHINPAFLSEASSGEVAVSFARMLSDVDYAFASTAYHIENIGTFGVGIRFINYGEFDHIDANGNDLGTFRAIDSAIKLAYSRSYAEILRYGVAVDYIYSSYESYTSTGVAFSGGLHLSLPDDMTVGLSFFNLGTQLSTYDGVREDLPFDLRLGVSRKLLYLPLRLHFTAHSLHKWNMDSLNDTEDPGFVQHLMRHLTIGGEFLFSENFNLRIGYDHFLNNDLKADRRLDLVGFGFGVGINVRGVGVDIARRSYSEMGHLLQIGIRTRL